MGELAGKIAIATATARSISLSVKNLSSVDGGEVTVIGEKLQAELARIGLTVGAPESADVAITLTLSEAVDGYVWVAELRTLAGSKVVMTKPKTPPKGDTIARLSVVLGESRLVSSSEPVLDFSLASGFDGQPLLLLLRADRLELFGRKNDSWIILSTDPIHHAHTWPRDLRGYIETVSPAQFQIFLPGVLCTGGITPSLSAECRNLDNPVWPPAEPLQSISFASNRNYFVASESAANHEMPNLPPFYTFAVGAADHQAQLILAGVDGVALLAQKSSATSISENWGDQISSLSLPCSADWYVLADLPGDWTQPDRLQIFRITPSSAISIGHPLDLPGPVLALWSSKDGKSVRVVSRNLQTGMYETSMVSASCGN